MKLLFWGEFPPNTKTGISVCSDLICNHLIQSNVQVTKVEEISWNKQGLAKLTHMLRICIQIVSKAIFTRYSVFYFTFPLSLQGMLKVLLIIPLARLFLLRTSFITHIHRGDFKMFMEHSALHRSIVKFNLIFINTVITLSEPFKNEFEQFIPGKQMPVLYNTSPIENRAITPKQNNDQRFCCISNIIPTKGLTGLVQCFNHPDLSGACIDIFGSTYNRHFMDELKSLAGKNINFPGPLARADMLKTLQQYDALVVPSPNEGQPIIILEAMSIGLPVIACSVGDIPNMLGRDYPFLAEPNKVNSLRNAILAYRNNNNKGDVSKKLYQRYWSVYSKEKFYNNINNIFTKPITE